MCVFGLLLMNVISGVGYDVVYFVCVVLIVMIFVLCKDGISYNEIEDVDLVYLEVGCNVLLYVMLGVVGIVGG